MSEINTNPAAEDPQFITVVRLKNPFNVKNYDKEQVVWSAEKTVADYLPQMEKIKGTDEMEVTFVVSVNGRALKEEEYGVYYLNPGDNIIICPVPGKSGKSIFKVIALIAVAVIAPQLGGMIAQGMTGMGMGLGGFASTFSMGQFIGTAISFVGKALVSTMFAEKPQKNRAAGDSLDSSPSYGYDGAKNLSAEGVVVPVVYGQFRMGGNLVSAYIENIGNTQYIYMLLAASEGPITGIADIKINDQPLANFRDVVTDIRLGTPNQPIMGWFGDNYSPQTLSQKLTPDWLYYNTKGEVDKLRFDVAFPAGLFKIDTKKGRTLSYSVELQIQYRKKGTTAWQTLSDRSVISHYERRYLINGVVYTSLPPGYVDGKSLVKPIGFGNWTPSSFGNWQPATFGNWSLSGYGSVQYNANTVYVQNTNYQYYTGWNMLTKQYVPAGSAWDEPIYKPIISVSGKSRSTIRSSFMTPLLSEGEYETRYRRTTAESTENNISDSCYLNEINEIVTDDVQYNNTALLAVRVKLSDQLSGLPRVTYLVNGVKIRVWDRMTRTWAYETSDNPAWVSLDMLTNSRYGAGLADNRLDLEMWKEWAEHCDTRNLTFNGSFDTTLSLWSALQYVMRSGHAQVVIVGTRITVAIERPSTPVMMFSVANMVEGSFQLNWLPLSDRANEIEVSYFDAVDDYKQRTIKVIDSQAISNGAPPKSTSITLFGVTDTQRAYNEGMFMINMNRYILQTVQFDATIEAIGCTIGDLIYVQHDMPQWGYAGRLEAGCTTSVLKLDRKVPMKAGKIHRALVVFDAIQRYTGSISHIAGTSLYLTGFDGIKPVKRVKVGAKDLEVLSVFTGGEGLYGVVVSDVIGLVTGAEYTLWDTDVLEERDVVTSSTGEFDTVTLQSPLSQTPAQFSHFMFGENAKMKKPFRVRAISGSGDYTRTIQAVEYNESVYDYDDTTAFPTPNYSALVSTVEHVTVVGVSESLFRIGTGFGVHVTINYSSSQESYRTSKVLLSRNGDPYVEVGTDRASVTVIATDGEQLGFRIVASDVLGRSAPESSAPTIIHNVVGKAAPPADVQGLNVAVRAEELYLSWLQNTQDIDIDGYEVRVGSSWDSGEVIFRGSALSASYKTSIAGNYSFHIRAYDTSGVYSKNVKSYQIDLTNTATVKDFIAVQVGGRIDMRWEPNPEDNILHYEIREGINWLSSTLVAQTKTTTYSVPSGGGTRYFWIKAVKSPGIPSLNATFTTTDIARSDDRNLLLTFDNAAAGWSGVKNNVEVDSGIAHFIGGSGFAEYMFTVDLGAKYRATNTLYTAFEASKLSNVTWDSATFAWDAPDAKSPWSEGIDMSNVEVHFQIALEKGLDASEIDVWRLDNSLNSVNGTAPTYSYGVTYPQNGRFSSGAYASQVTAVGWDVAFPATFRYTFWIRPQTLNDGRYLTFANDAEELAVGYQNGKFYLRDNMPREVQVPFTYTPNEMICVCVVQTATARKLLIGSLAGKFAEGQGAIAPATSPYTKLRLH